MALRFSTHVRSNLSSGQVFKSFKRGTTSKAAPADRVKCSTRNLEGEGKVMEDTVTKHCHIRTRGEDRVSLEVETGIEMSNW